MKCTAKGVSNNWYKNLVCAYKIEAEADINDRINNYNHKIYEFTGVIDKFIEEAECRKMTGLTNQMRQKLEEANLFPLRRSFGKKVYIWLLSEVLDWMHDRQYFILEN